MIVDATKDFNHVNMKENKQKAGRNRTLTVLPNEVATLENFITHTNDLLNHYEDDIIVCGDLNECIDHIPDRYFDLIIMAQSEKPVENDTSMHIAS